MPAYLGHTMTGSGSHGHGGDTFLKMTCEKLQEVISATSWRKAGREPREFPSDITPRTVVTFTIVHAHSQIIKSLERKYFFEMEESRSYKNPKKDKRPPN